MAPEPVVMTNVGAIVLGSFITYFTFQRYEPDNPSSILLLLILVPVLITSCLLPHISFDLEAYLAAIVSHITLVLLYTVIYRISPLHPLANYPGPFPAKISKLWASYICSQGKQHLYYQSLHEEYGDFVRVGPNEISIRDASAVRTVLGPHGLPKGPFWSNRQHGPILVGIQDPMEHARRRKVWNRAFTTAAVKGYEEIIEKRSKQLVDCLDSVVSRQEGGHMGLTALVDLAKWMSYFTMDLMGDMAFGGGFELVKEGRDVHGVWAMINHGLEASAMVAQVPWVLKFVGIMPSITKAVARVEAFSNQHVDARMKMGASRRDIFYYLNDEERNSDTRPSAEELSTDGILAIVGGSDTTATVLTALFCDLVLRPEAYKCLQDEIERVFPNGESPVDAVSLSQMTWLNGCINEAARLHPPVLSGSQRTVMKGTGPKVIAGQIIPEGTHVFVHTYSIHRDPRNFSDPNAFLPERWADPAAADMQLKLVTTHNPAAYHAFSYGPANCAGKNMALLEMRMVVCWLLQRFQFQHAGDRDGKPGPGVDEWEDGVQDFYVACKPPLWLKVTRRY